MAKNKDELAVLHDDQFALFDDDAPIVDANQIMSQSGLNAERIPASELNGVPFRIRYYKQFETSKNKRGYAYFCVIALEDTGELRTTVLGGDNVVDFLDMAKAVAPKSPIRMLLVKEVSASTGREFWVIR